MATTAPKGDDRSEKRRRPFGKATTVYETEICVGAQDTRTYCPGSCLREYVDKGYCAYTYVVPPGSRAGGCSPPVQLAETKEETGCMRNLYKTSFAGKVVWWRLGLPALCGILPSCSSTAASSEAVFKAVFKWSHPNRDSGNSHSSHLVNPVSRPNADVIPPEAILGKTCTTQTHTRRMQEGVMAHHVSSVSCRHFKLHSPPIYDDAESLYRVYNGRTEVGCLRNEAVQLPAFIGDSWSTY
ncbi:Fibrinogen- domains (FReDs) [Branchiostoma belcheri]|nr:Fibrinogen- domains (FReDs) [Branchiostoma belcheri]